MAKNPIPRKPSGVQVRVGKSASSHDTRDARDDSVIISWLQKIDMDIASGVKGHLFSGTPVSLRSETAPGSETKSKKLGDEIERIGASAIAFNRSAESMRKAILELAILFQPSRWLGMISGFRAAIGILQGKPLERQDAPMTPPRGLHAVQEFSFSAIRAGLAPAPVIQAGPNAGSTIFTPGPGALAPIASAAAGTAPRAAAGAVASAGLGLGSVALAIGAVAAVAIGFAVLTPLLAKFGQSVFDANKAFAASGVMANVIAMQNARDILRNMGTGNATAGSAQFLGNALGDLKDDLQPLIQLLRNVSNMVAGFLLKLGSALANLPVFGTSMKDVVKYLNGILENTMPKVEGEGMGDWLGNIADKAADRQVGFQRPFAVPGSPKARIGGWTLGSSVGLDFGGEDF